MCVYACITYTIWVLQRSLGISVGCGSMGTSLSNYDGLIRFCHEESQIEGTEPKLKVTQENKKHQF